MGYLAVILVHPVKRQNFALDSTTSETASYTVYLLLYFPLPSLIQSQTITGYRSIAPNKQATTKYFRNKYTNTKIQKCTKILK